MSFKFQKGERGATLVDYSVVIGLVVLVSVGSLVAFSDELQRLWCEKVMQVAVDYDPSQGMTKPIQPVTVWMSGLSGMICDAQNSISGKWFPLYPVPQ